MHGEILHIMIEIHENLIVVDLWLCYLHMFVCSIFLYWLGNEFWHIITWTCFWMFILP